MKANRKYLPELFPSCHDLKLVRFSFFHLQFHPNPQVRMSSISNAFIQRFLHSLIDGFCYFFAIQSVQPLVVYKSVKKFSTWID